MSVTEETESEEVTVNPAEENVEPVAEGNAEGNAEEAPQNSEEAREELPETGAPDSEYSLKRVLEAILFASQKPVASKELIAVLKGAATADKENPTSPARAFAKVKVAQIQAAIEELELECGENESTHEVRETAAGWQLVTKPEYSPWLRQLYPENRPARLSAPALETLAIIAYRQPITRADIEAVRGVAVDGVMQTILDRGLVKIAGRADVPGRPLLYETSQFFMEHFGLKDLEDLPNASELRTISLPTAEPPGEKGPETTVPAENSEEGGGEPAADAADAAEAPEAEEASVEPPDASDESVKEEDPVGEGESAGLATSAEDSEPAPAENTGPEEEEKA